MTDSAATSFVKPMTRSQHTDVKDDGAADLIHHGIVHVQRLLSGIDLSLLTDKVGVGYQKPSGPDDGIISRVCLLGQTDQHIGLNHLGIVDIRLGDDDIAAGCPPSGFRTVGLSLYGD